MRAVTTHDRGFGRAGVGRVSERPLEVELVVQRDAVGARRRDLRLERTRGVDGAGAHRDEPEPRRWYKRSASRLSCVVASREPPATLLAAGGGGRLDEHGAGAGAGL